MSAGSWLSGSVCVLLAGLAGCSLPESWNFREMSENDDSAGGEYVVGNLEEFASSAQGTLWEMGIDSTAQQDGKDRIVLHCATKAGTRFSLILERGPTLESEITQWNFRKRSTGRPPSIPHTRIDFAWESAPDYRLSCQVLGAVTALDNR